MVAAGQRQIDKRLRSAGSASRCQCWGLSRAVSPCARLKVFSAARTPSQSVRREVRHHRRGHLDPLSCGLTVEVVGQPGPSPHPGPASPPAALPLLASLSQPTSVPAWLINLCLNGTAVGSPAAMPKSNNHLDLNPSCFPSLTTNKATLGPAGQELK